ncbi:MAG: hypothetical protein RLZZ262_1908 [Bacteroidota bacterium]|jgi:hypothetical protein
MQKKMLITFLVLIIGTSTTIKAQYTSQDTTFKKWFIGTSVFVLLGNAFESENPPNFAQLDLGFRLNGKDILRLSPKTWKYAWPNGIHPFLNSAYKKQEERFPGYVREIGITASYQRFFWKNFYAQLDIMPTHQIFVGVNDKKIGNGFQIFNSYRMGYHFKFCKDRFFFQPSVCMTHRAYHTPLPNGFKQLDDKWPKTIFPEPGLNIGVNF